MKLLTELKSKNLMLILLLNEIVLLRSGFTCMTPKGIHRMIAGRDHSGPFWTILHDFYIALKINSLKLSRCEFIIIKGVNSIHIYYILPSSCENLNILCNANKSTVISLTNTQKLPKKMEKSS